MCDHGDTVPLQIMGEPRDVDRCLVPMVAALNGAGFATRACCCGHGHRPGSIALWDGRELVIARDWDQARAIDALFPLDIHGHQGTAPTESLPDPGATDRSAPASPFGTPLRHDCGRCWFVASDGYRIWTSTDVQCEVHWTISDAVTSGDAGARDATRGEAGQSCVPEGTQP